MTKHRAAVEGVRRNSPRAPSLQVLIAVVFSFASESFAQNVPAQPPALTLSLADAVKLALKQSPRRVAATILTEQGAQDVRIATAALLPQAVLTANAALAQYNFQSVESLPRPEPAGPFQVMEAGPEFSLPIFNASLLRRRQISKQAVRTADAQEAFTREDIVDFVVQQYLAVLRAYANRDAIQSRLALAERLFHQAADLQKNGIGTRIDTLRAQVELQNERQLLIDAETATRTNTYLLAELLDLLPDQQVELSDRLKFSSLPVFDRSRLITQALTTRPEIKILQSQQRIAALTVRQSADERLPGLTFTGYWFNQGKHFTDGIPAYEYQLSVQIPLFTGGRIRAESARGRLEEQRLEQQERALEAQIVRQVKVALDELESARTSVDVATLGLQLANDEVAQAERRFQAGVTTNIEIVTAQDELARASNNQINALYVFNRSRASLARAVGEIESTYSR